MKAAWYEKNGAPRDTLVVGDIETPQPGAGEVRVKLATSGVNPSDVKSRAARPVVAPNGPRVIPHSDGAGIIDAVGAGVPQERVGERVWTWNAQWQRPFGTAAQYVTLPQQQAVTLPDDCDFAAAACFGIPALTAYEAVRQLGDVRGQTILLIGAASAVAHYAAQFAVLKGARVIGTVGSEERANHARSAGVSELIFYKTEDVAQRVLELTGGKGVDAVIDMDFSSTAGLLSTGMLRAHGKVSCYGSNSVNDVPIPFRYLLMHAISLHFFVVYDLTPEERAEAQAEIGKLLAAGKLKHSVGARFPLDQIAAAHEAVEAGKVIGNVVLDIA